VGYKVSHMDIDSEEKEASKDDHIDPYSPLVHPLYYQEESIEPTKPVDLPRDIAITRKRSDGFVTLCRMKRSIQLQVILSGRENDLKDS
jgi:hypothetical protein